MKKTITLIATATLTLFANQICFSQTLAQPTITIKCSGEMSVSCTTGTLTTLEIVSNNNYCDPTAAQNTNGIFDVKSYNKMFKMVPSTGFTSWYIGFVACKCRNQSFWQANLSVNGSSLPSGGLGPVTIVGEAGCANLAPTISVNSPTAYPSCGVSATITPTVSPSGLNYQWSNASTASSLIIMPPPSTFGVVYTNPTTGCNSAAVSTVVTGNTPSISLVANISGSLCPGSSKTLTASSGFNTYSWSTGSTNSVITVSPLSNTTYSAQGTLGTCTSTASIVVNVNSINVSAATNSTSICGGYSAVLTATGATTYTWNPGNFTGANYTTTPGTTTIYTVTGAKSSCSQTKTISITVNPTPTVSVSANPSILCTGNSSTLTASGANNYTWSNSTTGPNTIVSPTATTSYTVTGTNLSGCVNSAVITQSVSTCTGLNEHSPEVNFSVYPNPSNGMIKILIQNLPDNTVISLINAIGQTVFNTQATEEVTLINLSEFDNGLYTIKVSNNSSAKTTKIILQE